MSLEAYRLSWSNLDQLLPMSVIVAQTGHITHVGRTLAKLRPGTSLAGKRFLETFQLLRPKVERGSVAELRKLSGQPLRLAFRDNPRTRFRGVPCVLEQFDGVLINTSFGIADFDAVRDYGLNRSDFSPTDLTFDMTFLHEAKIAVEAEYGDLARVLDASKKSAEIRALKDPLTDLGNRAALDARLNWLLEREIAFSVLCIDLDLFKEVNDTHGHAAGDAVLVNVANRLLGLVRSGDHISRMGGDEFVVLLEGAQCEEWMSDLSEKVIRQIEKPIPFKDAEICISGSIGFNTSARYSQPCKETIMADTDVALYAAKHRGRGCSVGH